jgi:hypothetical protein
MPGQARGGLAPCAGQSQIARELTESKTAAGRIKAVTNEASASRTGFAQVVFFHAAKVITGVLLKRVRQRRPAGGIPEQSIASGLDRAVDKGVPQSGTAAARSERFYFRQPVFGEKIALTSSAQHLANCFYRKPMCVPAQCMGDGFAYVVGRKNRLGGPFGNVPPAPQHWQASMRSITHGEFPCQKYTEK